MEYNNRAHHNFSHEQIGYEQSLSHRHVQMIALGGAIGSGIFLGSAQLMHNTGPAIIISYIIVSLISLALMRTLGELVLYRSTSSAFVSYTREFFGEKWAYIVGWMYWLQWSIIGIADLSAVGSYLAPLFSQQTWPGALLGFILVMVINFASARSFAEFEFWASILKIIAIVIFFIAAIILIICGAKIGNTHANISHLYTGFWPVGHHGLMPLLVLNTVMFGFSAIELIAISAGEMQNPKCEVPRAVKSVLGRIIVFYIGSIFLFLCLQSSDQYISGTSPYVTIAKKINNHVISTYTPVVITVVLIIAVLSSLNSGLYSTGRVLRGLALYKQAPGWVSVLNKRGVPARGIMGMALMLIIGIILNYYMRSSDGSNPVFSIAMDAAALANIVVWISFFSCQLRYRSLVKRNLLPASAFPAPFYPYLSIIGILILIIIAGLCWGSGTPTGYHLGTQHNFTSSQLAIMVFPFFAIILIIGWLGIRILSGNSIDHEISEEKSR